MLPRVDSSATPKGTVMRIDGYKRPKGKIEYGTDNENGHPAGGRNYIAKKSMSSVKDRRNMIGNLKPKGFDPDPREERPSGASSNYRTDALKRRLSPRQKPALKSRGNIGGAMQALKPGKRMPKNGGAKGITPPGGGYQLFKRK